MSAISIRKLQPGDEAEIDAFLERHAESSMILRSNLAAVGLRPDRGQPLEGTWMAAVTDAGEIVAVAGHFWNGNVALQAPTAIEPLVRAVVANAVRPLGGIIGPWAQVMAGRAALGLQDANTYLDSKEILFALDLENLAVPAPLSDGRFRVRYAVEADHEFLAEWYAHYSRETLGIEISEKSRNDVAASLARRIAERTQFVLLDADDRALGASTFNAISGQWVQIGGVWTPVENRGRHIARACVAGSLRIANATGVRRSILFTGSHNVPAIRAYEAIGFRPIGDYAILIFRETHDFRGYTFGD